MEGERKIDTIFIIRKNMRIKSIIVLTRQKTGRSDHRSVSKILENHAEKRWKLPRRQIFVSKP